MTQKHECHGWVDTNHAYLFILRSCSDLSLETSCHVCFIVFLSLEESAGMLHEIGVCLLLPTSSAIYSSILPRDGEQSELLAVSYNES